MVSKSDRRYVGKAWGSLATTKNLFGKLLLLALVQLVPVLGPIVLFGCALGWAREAAWKMDTPLPDHVFGRDDPGFWGRGVKAFFATVLFQIVLGVVVCLVNYVPVGLANLVDLSGDALAVVTLACAVLSLLLAVLLALAFNAGLVRLAVYDRFGAAFQFGVCIQMVFRRFGGMVKILLAFFLLLVAYSVSAFLVAGAYAPGLASLVGSSFLVQLGLDSSGTYSAAATALEGLFGDLRLATVLLLVTVALAQLLLGSVSVMLELLKWRAFGNWVATFDVARWGGRFDRLPSQKAPLEAAEGARPADAPAEGAEPPAPAPVKRSHPVLLWVLGTLVAAALCGAASWFAVSAVAELRDAVDWAAVEQLIRDAIDEIGKAFEDTPFAKLFDDMLKEAGLGAADGVTRAASARAPFPTVEV